MGVTLLTFSGQNILPAYDAILYDALMGANGIIKGGAITLSGSNVLHIAQGYGIIAGRVFAIDATDVSVSLPASGSVASALYLHMDLSDADTPLTIVSGATPESFDGDADVNIDSGEFDLLLATYTATPSSVTNLTERYPTADGFNLKRCGTYAVGDIVRVPDVKDKFFVCTTAGTTAPIQPYYGSAADPELDIVEDGTAEFAPLPLKSTGSISGGTASPVFGQYSQLFSAPKDGDYIVTIDFDFGSSSADGEVEFSKNEKFEVSNERYARTTVLRAMSQGDSFSVAGYCGTSGVSYTARYKYKRL